MSSPITTELVKELRDATGISIMQCRKALEEAQGDMKVALAILKKNSSAIAEKKMGREAKDGAVKVVEGGNKTVLVALHCETDFVSHNEDFLNLLDKLAEKALASGGESAKTESADMINQVIQKTGENIQVGEISEITGDVVGNYVHNGKIAVVVSLAGGNKELARDIAMHIAAMKPEYIEDKDVDEEAKKMMVGVFEKEVANVDKPEDIKKKMLEGKINTYFKEKTLIHQPFIKDGNTLIKDLLQKAQATIKEVKRYSI